MAEQMAAHEDLPTLINRLAGHYHWTPEEQTEHAQRLYDIRRTNALRTAQDRVLIPVVRTPTSLDAFYAVVEARFTAAQRVLQDLDDH